MLENNNIEDLIRMRSILEEGTEEVPAHIWEDVSAGLDRANRKKVAFIWLRRAGIASAVAASLLVGIFFSLRQVENKDLIQVIEPAGTDRQVEILAMAPDKTPESFRTPSGSTSVIVYDIPEKEEECTSDEHIVPQTIEKAEVEKVVEIEKEKEETKEDFVDKYDSGEDWIETKDKKSGKGIKASIVVSGLTGTNNAQSPRNANLMKRPTPSRAPAVTGVKQSSTTSTFGVPVSVGLGAKIRFTDRWSLGVGVNYSYLTRKFYGTYTEVDSEGNIDYSESADFRNNQHFIGIPVNAYFNIIANDRINFYTYAGGAVERCVADKYVMLGKDFTYSAKPKGVQWSVNVGLGVEFMLGKTVGIYLDPSLRYYFNCGQPSSIRTEQPLMLAFEAGLRFKI